MRLPVPVAAALGVAFLLTGCGGPDGPGPSSSSTSTDGAGGPASFNGDGAWAFVRDLISEPGGADGFRVPGTDGHRDAAAELHAAMAGAPGWSVAWQNFTGEEYAGLDKGGVAVYADSAAYCQDADRARLAGLAFSNLVATREADEPSDRTLILGAHWDSKAEANQDPAAANRSKPVLGANDGASGVGVLLQLMRELDGVALPYTMQVVLFDGEDGFEDCHPLAGSLWFVHELQRQDAVGGAGPDGEGAQRRMLLLDMVGDPDARFIREGHSMECDEALVDRLHDLAPEHGLLENFPGTVRTVQDDHVPFTEAGIPAVDLIDFGRSGGTGFPPYWHTTQDTLDKVDAGMLGRVGALVLAVMQDPSFTAEWPGRC